MTLDLSDRKVHKVIADFLDLPDLQESMEPQVQRVTLALPEILAPLDPPEQWDPREYKGPLATLVLPVLWDRKVTLETLDLPVLREVKEIPATQVLLGPMVLAGPWAPPDLKA